MPASSTSRMAMIAVNVRWAVFTIGSRNAVTPLLTASTPVIAVHPLANDLSSSQPLSPTVATGNGGGGTTGVGCPPEASAFVIPITSVIRSVPTKRYVGIMKRAPVSRTPRKFTSVMSSRMTRQSGSVWGSRDGAAETSAPTPAEIPTAAVKT